MYRGYFGMTRRPFAATPHLGAYYASLDCEEAIATLNYCITQGRGIGLLTGAPGTGKTMVCHRLATRLTLPYTTAMIMHTNVSTPKALLQATLYDLALPYRGMDEQELRLTLTDFLLGRYSDGGQTTVIVDEAQNLSTASLEEIRLLSNLESELDKLIHIVLVGQPRLLEMLLEPELEPLNQRIGARATLDALDEEETVAYVEHQLRYAGVEPEKLFSSDATAAVYEATIGVPRLIHRLCEHTLMLAYVTEASAVTGELVEQAQADLNRMELETQAVRSLRRSPVQAAVQTPHAADQGKRRDDEIIMQEEIIVDPYAAMDEARGRPSRTQIAVSAAGAQAAVPLAHLEPKRGPSASELSGTGEEPDAKQVLSVQPWDAAEEPACYEIGADTSEPTKKDAASDILIIENQPEAPQTIRQRRVDGPQPMHTRRPGGYRRLFSYARKT